MRDDERLSRVIVLGREFARRGMEDHARSLRLYYVVLKSGLARNGTVEVRWSPRLTEEWLKTLRVPPFEDAYPVRAPGAPCARCRPEESHPSVRTELVFPGGGRMRCDRCGSQWLVLDAAFP